jgi:hypothetical protein
VEDWNAHPLQVPRVLVNGRDTLVELDEPVRCARCRART